MRRARVDSIIDAVRFKLDTFPDMQYQPLPWLGKHRARRAAGVRERWQTIAPLVDKLKPQSALDIGANVGYFTISLALSGVRTIAVEQEPHFYRTLIYATRRLNLKNVGLLIWQVEPSTYANLPRADATLFLSVWHHIVRIHGDLAAREVLRGLWRQTGRVMFFETGESEMPAFYGLPDMGGDSKTFLERMLRDECAGGEVTHLGLHDAFDHYRRPCKRNLFAIQREPEVV